MSKHNTVHVTPKGKNWQVKSANAKKAHRVVSTQQEAINIAKPVAQNKQAELKIHNKQGQVRQSTSYGNDPFPPRG